MHSSTHTAFCTRSDLKRNRVLHGTTPTPARCRSRCSSGTGYYAILHILRQMVLMAQHGSAAPSEPDAVPSIPFLTRCSIILERGTFSNRPPFMGVVLFSTLFRFDPISKGTIWNSTPFSAVLFFRFDPHFKGTIFQFRPHFPDPKTIKTTPVRPSKREDYGRLEAQKIPHSTSEEKANEAWEDVWVVGYQ